MVRKKATDVVLKHDDAVTRKHLASVGMGDNTLLAS